jgi:hypothetical protein
MPVWNPVAHVYVNTSTEYSGSTLADVSITYGKKDQTEKFRASFASVTMVCDGAGLPILLNDKFTITFEDSTATEQLIFTGRVFDISTKMLAPDWLEITYQLMSPLAHLGRRIVGYSGYSEQYEGERIAAILEEAGQITWAQAGGTWADQTGTWLQYESISGSIDTGLYNLHSYNLDPGSVTDFLNICELSGLGFLYETTDGLMNYGDIKDRVDRVVAIGWEAISPDDVLLSGIESQVSTQFTSTAVIVSSYNNSHTILVSLNSGVGDFGKIYENFETWIKANGDLESWAKWYVVRFGNDYPVLSSFTIPLSQVSDAVRDDLIQMFPGLPVEITGLPAGVASSPYQGYVEGYTWRINQGEAFMTLNISPKQYSDWKAIGPGGASNFDVITL